MAFLTALKAGGVSSGNPHNGECVTAFREVFEKGLAKPGDIILVGSNVKARAVLFWIHWCRGITVMQAYIWARMRMEFTNPLMPGFLRHRFAISPGGLKVTTDGQF